MKLNILLVCLLVMATVSYAQDNNKTSGVFGEEIDKKGAMPAKKLPGKLDAEEELNVKVKGTISEVCQSKGCWMTIDLGDGEMMRVKFKDYGFFVPKDAAGKTAVFEGEAKYETVDVKTLKHYAEDAGKSQEEIDAITEPETKLTFVASGVEILEK